MNNDTTSINKLYCAYCGVELKNPIIFTNGIPVCPKCAKK